MRESSGVEYGADAGIDAAGEAAKGGGGLDNEVGGGIGIGDGGGYGGDGAELDVGKLLGAVSDDLVLHLSDGFQFDFAIGGGQAVQDGIGRKARGGGGWHLGGGSGGRRRRKSWRWMKLMQGGGGERSSASTTQLWEGEREKGEEGERAFCFCCLFLGFFII